MKISTIVWSAQHPNAGKNIQPPVLASACDELDSLQKVFDILMSRKGTVTVRIVAVSQNGKVVTVGTGPLACLSLFPVAELDKVSWD